MSAMPRFLAVALALISGLEARGQSPAARVERQGARWTLANARIEYAVETSPYVRIVSLTNRLPSPARSHRLESRGFVLALDNESLKLSAADFQAGEASVKQEAAGATLVIPLRCEKHGLRATVSYWIGAKSFYLRKQVSVEPGEHLLNWIDVDSLRLDVKPIQRFDQQRMPFHGIPWDIPVGRPIFVGQEFFLGVEHPASVNSCDEDGWISLRQHPGRKGRVESSPAVIGVCPDRERERLLDYFEQYLDENRACPIKRSLQWIAYFTAGMDDQACRDKIAVAEKVFRQRQVPLDVVLMDSGWTEPQSIMGISRQRPDRLALMSKLVRQRLGAELGLHVITSGVKPMVDKDWLAAQGYDMIYHRSKEAGAYCFADPRVLEVFSGNLARYARDHHIAAYKFDWGHFACGVAGHRGHLPGEKYGFEAGATNFMRAHQALRQVNPKIFLFNTGWYSPWWLWTYDAVFCSGADYNFGLDGPPAFSTAALLCTWRDATIRGNIVRWSPFFPINSLMTVDPISYWWHDWSVRAESPLRPFTDYFLVACLRGTQMIEVYNTIVAWSDAHADAAAAVLRWMKAHDDVILASTRYLGGDPMRAEPYGYAHFRKDNRGIVVIRNPDLKSRQMAIPLDEATGFWPGRKQYVVRIVYPFTVTLGSTYGYGGHCVQELAGDEVRVLEVWPIDALPEPMPIGCRYQVTAREPGKTGFRFARLPATLDVFSPVAIDGARPQPGHRNRYVLACPGSASGSRAAQIGDCPNAREAKMGSSPSPLSLVRQGRDWHVAATVPPGAKARLALVLDRPGVSGQWTLAGETIPADAPHVLLPDANGRTHGTRARASDWSLFGIELAAGRHELQFTPRETARAKKPAAPARAQVILDVSQELDAEQSLSLAHAPLPPRDSQSLPTNWVWQTRHVTTAEGK